MANKVILDTAYTFTPSTKTIVIPKYIARERLIEIVNVTTHHTLYQRYETTLNATSYTAVAASSGVSELTTIVLNRDTTTGLFASTDKLQIIIDEPNVAFTPAEMVMDPTNKHRVTTPQSLIDTDFEYGTQVSKWENLATTNLRPFAYASPSSIAGITAVAPTTAGKRSVTVSTGTTNPSLAAGDVVSVQDTLNPIANGVFVVDSIAGTNPYTFTYTARAAFATTASIFDTYKTIVTKGTLYSNAQIGGALTLDISAAPIIKVTTTAPHGLSLGNEIQVSGITGTNPPNGSFVVSNVISPAQFHYVLDADAATPSALTTTSSKVYARPQGAVLHRPFDGGVIFSSNGSSNYETTTRQTRRYFRYQSGKGILFSSGTILKPNFQLDGLSFATATNLVTVTTKDQHNLQPGSTIVVSGANEALFNGTVTIYGITGYNKFTYTPTVANGGVDVTASGTYYASITGWYGAVNRLGIFDQQNGLFFEYDGQTLYAVRRNSTYQVTGRVDVVSGSVNVTANASFPTAFSKQLTPGDFVVLRGQSYRVDSIISDNALTISPAYRGGDDVVAANLTKTVDTRMAQSQWNLDRMDGTGPSGYNMDLSRMQMFYIDYSWYGAGFIRWGLRGSNGDVTYVHKMQNNNVNFEAYMRSGNLPGRYESSTQPPKTISTTNFSTGSTSITVASTTGFPSSGTLVVKGPAYTAASAITSSSGNGTTITHLTTATLTTGQVVTISGCSIPAYNGTFVVTGASAGVNFTVAGKTSVASTGGTAVPVSYEFANYTGTTATTFTGLTRAQAGVPAGTTVTMNVGANSGTVSSASGIQVGQRVISKTSTAAFPDGTFVTAISGTTITFSQALTGSKANPADPTVIFQPMGLTSSPTVFPLSSTSPGVVELAYPTYAPTISHWGTSVIMDGRFDDDKSLLFTYGQVATTSVTSGSTVALMAIRVAPSVDNGKAAAFGQRDLVNRMQLVLRALDISMTQATATQLLVTAVLNGTPSTSTNWLSLTTPTSSLAQIADYSGGTTTVTGGEVTGGFFVGTTAAIELDKVRDLGNSILGGGGTTSNSGIYPDGPDTLTIVVKNVGGATATVVSRLSWTEAQA